MTQRSPSGDSASGKDAGPTHMNDSFSDELISAYLDGDLAPAEVAQVERHLAESAEARQICDDLRSLKADWAALPRERSPVDFRARVLAAIAVPATAAKATKETSDAAAVSPRRDLPAAAGISWLAVTGLLGTLAAGIAAILMLPSWNRDVAGPNVTPNLPARHEERPAPPDAIRPAVATTPVQRDAAGQNDSRDAKRLVVKQQAEPTHPGEPGAGEGLVERNIEPQRNRAQNLTDGLGGRGRGPEQPVPGKSLPAEQADAFAKEAARRLSMAPSRPGAAARSAPGLERAEGPDRKELKDAASDDVRLRQTFENQGIALDARRRGGADKNDFAREGRGGREFSEEAKADLLREKAADGAADRIAANGAAADKAEPPVQYIVVEASQARIDQVVAELRKQGTVVEIDAAPNLPAEQLAGIDAEREVRMQGLGGAQGFAAGPAGPQPVPPTIQPPAAAPQPPPAPAPSAEPAAPPRPAPLPLAPAVPLPSAGNDLVVGRPNKPKAEGSADADQAAFGGVEKKRALQQGRGYAWHIDPRQVKLARANAPDDRPPGAALAKGNAADQGGNAGGGNGPGTKPAARQPSDPQGDGKPGDVPAFAEDESKHKGVGDEAQTVRVLLILRPAAR